jgi:hypothetical protein
VISEETWALIDAALSAWPVQLALAVLTLLLIVAMVTYRGMR